MNIQWSFDSISNIQKVAFATRAFQFLFTFAAVFERCCFDLIGWPLNEPVNIPLQGHKSQMKQARARIFNIIFLHTSELVNAFNKHFRTWRFHFDISLWHMTSAFCVNLSAAKGCICHFNGCSNGADGIQSKHRLLGRVTRIRIRSSTQKAFCNTM